MFAAKFPESLEVIKAANVVVMGAFNYPCIDLPVVLFCHDKEEMFLELINDCASELLVRKPTRGDVVLNWAQNLVSDVNVVTPVGSSNYNAIMLDIHVNGK